MRAEYFIMFFIHHKFDPAGLIAQLKRLAIGLEGESPDFDGVTTFFRLRHS